jgi:hypothetical protein
MTYRTIKNISHFKGSADLFILSETEADLSELEAVIAEMATGDSELRPRPFSWHP